jgi:NADP-dependent alcohol dehydrogenase
MNIKINQMENFEFYNPVRVLLGKGQAENLNKLIPTGINILLTYGSGSIFKNGVYDDVKKNLSGYEIEEFGGIEPNPSYETAIKAVEIIKQKKIGFILAVGGGSVIDASKYMAAAACYEKGDPWQILEKGEEIEKAMPIGTILTLPATGTEMNANSVISRKSTHEKLAFSSVKVMPQFSILDPCYASSLPNHLVANGVVDAFVHVIEQYMTFSADAPLQDRMAESILKTLIEIGPKVYKNPSDYKSMANLMWCATMALNGIISVGVPQDWATHTIGHELTAFHGIDHARTLAIVLPGVWSVLRNEKKEKLLQYASRILEINNGEDNDKINTAILKTSAFFESLGIPTKLSNYGIKEDTIERIVERFKKRRWNAIGDRQLITPEKVNKILLNQL